MANKTDERKKIIAIRASSVKDGALKRRKEVGEKGMGTGYSTLDELISYKKGYSTIIYSYAHQGKTQFTIDQCVNMAVMYGEKVGLYLTEAGDAEEIVLEVAQTYMRISLADRELTDSELDYAITHFVNEYFFIMHAPGQLFNITDLAYAIKDTNEFYGITLGVMVIDHFGNLEKDEAQKYFKTDENVKYVMQRVNRLSKKYNIHTFILFHLRDTDPVKCPVTGKFYLPRPEHHNISGGQQANYQGMQMIAIWRPIYHPNKFGIVDPDTGVPYEMNETRVIVTKSKPKHIGMLGERSLYFRVESQSYKERVGGSEYYAREYFNSDARSFGDKPLKYPSFQDMYEEEEKERKKAFVQEIITDDKDNIPTISFSDLGF